MRLHLEIKGEYLTNYQKRMLKRYGESSTRESITRDILIPSDMPLHNLHYAIQKLFGWQNSHLRSFYLPEERYQELTGGTVKGWSDLVGVLFQPPSEAEHDIFWDDDYQRGNINTWLKKKYAGPYFYGGILEHPDAARRDMKRLLDRFNMVEVIESFSDYWERSKGDDDEEMRVLRRAPLIELTLEEMNSSIMIEGGTESLLERLEVDKIIAAQDEVMDSKNLFPVTKELIYNYDFGDNWIIKITKYKDCEDLIRDNLIDRDELEEAEDTVVNKHKPVCLNKDGISVLDDVGGLSGFADLLGVIYEGEDKEEKANARAWAQSLGWSAKKMSNKMMI
ncbi:plasmid pRiA4b ORF-3 family protein [Alkalicella caledoniensis]|uniref:plasmid pRiA4b ORF-3 family protein n=1 Tax=Alkalicella caledoniensis TaxID=2731377 RepID=UPI001FE58C90|nr:plasmid pRiA4b ORF-3 family protein [Alkalicella caledoniensis]